MSSGFPDILIFKFVSAVSPFRLIPLNISMILKETGCSDFVAVCVSSDVVLLFAKIRSFKSISGMIRLWIFKL